MGSLFVPLVVFLANVGVAHAVTLQAEAANRRLPHEVEGDDSKAQQDFTELSSLFCQEVHGIVKQAVKFDKASFDSGRVQYDEVQDVLAYNNVTLRKEQIPADVKCEQTSSGTLDLKFGYKADDQTFRVNPLCGGPNALAVRNVMKPIMKGWFGVFMTVHAQYENCDGTIVMGITQDKYDENVQDFIGSCNGLSDKPIAGSERNSHEAGLFHVFRGAKFLVTGLYLFEAVAPGRYAVSELVYGINGTLSSRKNDRLEALKLTEGSRDELSYELNTCSSSAPRMAPLGVLSPLLDFADKRPTSREMYNYVALLQKLGHDGVW